MLTTIISFIIVLGFLIFVHELGHFLVAKRSGVTVLRFSLGFGPKIFGITRGKTEYRLSMLPLGGYVKMLGEDSGEELPPADRAGSFSEQKVSRRLAIVLAGPLSNFIWAILIFSFVFAFYGVPEPTPEPEVGSLTAGWPAEQAGLKTGDIILSINGQPIRLWDDIPAAVEKFGTNPLNLRVKRDDSEFSVTVTPRIEEIKNPLTGDLIRRPMIGIGRSEIFKPVNPLTAGYYAVDHTIYLSKTFFAVIGRLVERKLPLDTLGGPILIAEMTGKQAKKGLAALLNFVAFISVNLAVLNILPIPVLDGGHIFFFLVEAILGRPLSVKKIEFAQRLGLVALLSLIVVVFYNDIMRDWPSISSWFHALRSRL